MAQAVSKDILSDDEMAALEKSGAAKMPDVLSDSEMDQAQKQESRPWYDVSLKTAGKELVKGLPTAGAVGGGLLGGGLMSIPLAAGGAMAGKALQNVIESGYDEGPQSREELYKGLLQEGIAGAGSEVGGKAIQNVITKPLGMIAEYTKPVPKENAAEIGAAAGRLGFKPSPGMLLQNPQVQQLESSLYQSPSLVGSGYRKEFIEPGVEAISKNVESTLGGAKGMLPSEHGAIAKDVISKTIKGRAELPAMMFDDLKNSTRAMDVPEKTVQRIQSNISNIEGAKVGPARTAAQKWANEIQNVKSVDDLKILRTQAQRVASSPMIDPNEKYVAGEVAAKLTRAEQSQILRNALASAATKKEGELVGKEIINDFKTARGLWASLYKDLEPVKSAGVGKTAKTYSQVLTKLEEIPDEKIAEKLFTTQNRANLEQLKSRLPEAYESLRSAKLDAIRTSSLKDDELNLAKLLNSVKGIEEPTRKMIFGENSAQVIRDLETVKNAIPKMVGPSGTPHGIEVSKLLSLEGLGAELTRLKQVGLIKAIQRGGLITQPTVERISPLVKTGAQGLIYQGRGE